MAVVQYNVPNLSLTTSDAFHVPSALEYVYTEGDLDQLGMERSRQEAAMHVPAIAGQEIIIPGGCANPFIRAMIQAREGGEMPTDADLVLTVNSTALARLRIDGANEPNRIAELQAALDPVREVSLRTIVDDPRVGNAVSAVMGRLDRSEALVAAAWAELVHQDDNFSRWAIQAFAADERATIAEVTFTAKSIRDLSLADWITGAALWKSRSPEESAAAKVVDAAKMLLAAPNDATTYQHELLADTFSLVKADLTIQAFRCPTAIASLFNGDATMAAIHVGASWLRGSGDAAQSGKLAFIKKDYRPIKELVMYAMSARQITGVSIERVREFAATRMLIIRHGLIHDSTEVSIMEPKAPLIFEQAELSQWLMICKKPEMYYMCMTVAVVSFLKSGHHASAANLDNTLEKMLGAVSISVGREQSRNLLSTAVYNGTHPASMRLLVAYCMHRIQSKKLSAAISYRLSTAPPMAMGYHNLELFMDALNASEFFDTLNRTHEYRAFKEHMVTIRRTMWYVAPYSLYLYGKTMPDPTYAKQEAAKYAAYAAAITQALPDTTLVFSPALRKMAQQAAVNSISAQLVVQAYVEAFRRFFRLMITSDMAEKKKIKAQTAAMVGQ